MQDNQAFMTNEFSMHDGEHENELGWYSDSCPDEPMNIPESQFGNGKGDQPSSPDLLDNLTDHFCSTVCLQPVLPSGPMEYTITVKTKQCTECIFRSDTTFSYPGHKEWLKSFLKGSETTQIYTIEGESRTEWVENMENGLWTMGYVQNPVNRDWYRTDGESVWFKRVWRL